MFFLCTCGTLARGKIFFLEKLNKSILEVEQSQGVGALKMGLVIAHHIAWWKLFLIQCQGNVRCEGLVRNLQGTQPGPCWCGSVLMAFLLHCHKEGVLATCLLSAFPTRRNSWSKRGRIFFQLHSESISFQLLPMRNMILSDSVELRQNQSTQGLGVHGEISRRLFRWNDVVF